MGIAPVVYRARGCACPNTPHADGDTVTINANLTLAAGLTAEQQLLEVFARHPIDDAAPEAQKEAVGTRRSLELRPLWFETFIRHQTVGWNLTDQGGRPVPFRVDDLLTQYDLARPVGDYLADRFASVVLAPFLTEPVERSPTGPMDDSTPAPSEPIPSPSE